MNLSDQDMLQTLLDMHKYNAIQLTNMAQECSNEKLRKLVLASLDQTLKSQWELWQILNRKGYYQIHQPTQDDLMKTQQQMETLGIS